MISQARNLPRDWVTLILDLRGRRGTTQCREIPIHCASYRTCRTICIRAPSGRRPIGRGAFQSLTRLFYTTCIPRKKYGGGRTAPMFVLSGTCSILLLQSSRMPRRRKLFKIMSRLQRQQRPMERSGHGHPHESGQLGFAESC